MAEMKTILPEMPPLSTTWKDEGNNDNYRCLAESIIERAKKDYEYSNCKDRNAETFFLSDWCNLLLALVYGPDCEITGQMILEDAKEKVAKVIKEDGYVNKRNLK